MFFLPLSESRVIEMAENEFKESKFYQLFSGVLPKLEQLDPLEINNRRLSPLLFKSVAYSETESLLYIRCLNLNTKTTETIIVGSLNYFCGFDVSELPEFIASTAPDDYAVNFGKRGRFSDDSFSVQKRFKSSSSCDEDMEEITDPESTVKQLTAVFAENMNCQPIKTDIYNETKKTFTSCYLFSLNTQSSFTAFCKSNLRCVHPGCFDGRYYVAWDGNTPALMNNLMFGRLYYLELSRTPNKIYKPTEFVYDHAASEQVGVQFATYVPFFWKEASFDIETVYDKLTDLSKEPSKFDPDMMCERFLSHFPFCTVITLQNLTKTADRLRAVLAKNKTNKIRGTKDPKQLPLPNNDTSGERHEITCISLVISNTHVSKTETDPHRKKLYVFYNKKRACTDPVVADHIAKQVVIDPTRVIIVGASSEFSMIKAFVGLIAKSDIEVLYVYRAEFDVRVLNQRIEYYAYKDRVRGCCREHDRIPYAKGAVLKKMWTNFLVKARKRDGSNTIIEPTFQFEEITKIQKYETMLKQAEIQIKERGNCDQAISTYQLAIRKIARFKPVGFGFTFIDLYCVVATKENKLNYTTLKLNDIVPAVVTKIRKNKNLPAKLPGKLYKVKDVSYGKLDSMFANGGEDLYTVLIYNLVDSLLCTRLAKALNCVGSAFFRFKAAYNIDIAYHGRMDTFQGFVQSIHSVKMPMLKYRLFNLRFSYCQMVKSTGTGEWSGGDVAKPYVGLNYASPGLPLEVALDFKSMYPSIMCDLGISTESVVEKFWGGSVISEAERTCPQFELGRDWLGYDWSWVGENKYDNYPRNENFGFLTLILRYDPNTDSFVKHPATLAASAEYYLFERARYKRLLKQPDISQEERNYYSVQEVEMKVAANSHYGTAEWPCGPMTSGHGRRQIGFVNKRLNTLSNGLKMIVYGDTDSTMFTSDETVNAHEMSFRIKDTDWDIDENSKFTDDDCLDLLNRAVSYIKMKLKHPSDAIEEFLKQIHIDMLDDVLKRLCYTSPDGTISYPIKTSNVTKEGYPIYNIQRLGKWYDITTPFIVNRKTELEYETCASIYCHVAKKTYIELAHAVHGDRILNTSIKIRGLQAHKSTRTVAAVETTNSFTDVAIAGKAVVVESSSVSVFHTKDWKDLVPGDTIIYAKEQPKYNEFVQWEQGLGFDPEVGSMDLVDMWTIESVYNSSLDIDGYTICVVTAVGKHGKFRTNKIYKHGYVMNHMLTRDECVIRCAVHYRCAELITLKLSAGFFDWTRLPKTAKINKFKSNTIEKFQSKGVLHGSMEKKTYVETVKTRLISIFGFKPDKHPEFYKHDPVCAMFGRFPIEINPDGSIKVFFGTIPECPTKGMILPSELLVKGGLTEPRDFRMIGPIKTYKYNTLALSSIYGSSKTDKRPVVETYDCEPDSESSGSKGKDLTKGGKLGAHCIVAMLMPGDSIFLKTGFELQNFSEKVYGKLRGAYDTMKKISTIGQNMFYSIMNSCPPEMMPIDCPRHTLLDTNGGLYRLRAEKLKFFEDVFSKLALNARLVYDVTTGELNRSIRILEQNEWMFFSESPVSSMGGYGARCVGNIPTPVADTLDISDRKYIYMNGSDTSIPEILKTGQLLYTSIACAHFIWPDRFNKPSSSLQITKLCSISPRRAKQEIVSEWKSMFSNRYGKLKTIKFHCEPCKTFFIMLCSENITHDTFDDTVYDKLPDGIMERKSRFGMCIDEQIVEKGMM